MKLFNARLFLEKVFFKMPSELVLVRFPNRSSSILEFRIAVG